MAHTEKRIAIVPYHKYIEPMVMDSLRGLAALGYTIRESGNVSDVARQRGILASQALHEGYERILWVDSDVIFDPEDALRMESHGKEIVGGVCALRSATRFNCIFESNQIEVVFGEGGGLLKVVSVGTGFLSTHRSVYEGIIKAGLVTECHGDDGHAVYPFFGHQCSTIGNRKDVLYLGEDFSFCLRAKHAGFSIYVDTTVRLGHLGLHPFSWEDVITPVQRYSTCVAKIRQEGDS